MKADRHGFEGSDLAGAATARPENTAAGQKALREKLTAKAAALVPLLRAKAAEIEREGRIPDEVLAAIDAAQLFRLRTPTRLRLDLVGRLYFDRDRVDRGAVSRRGAK
jgi:hypothetical protein